MYYKEKWCTAEKTRCLGMLTVFRRSNETSYWLKLMYETKRIDLASYKYAEKLCGNIRRLLIASCKTAKENSQ